jgi:hypothetical protein
LFPADRKVAVPSMGLGPNIDNRTLYWLSYLIINAID